MRTSKKILFLVKALICFILIIACNFCLNYALIPSGSSSKIMWDDFNAMPDNSIDMIYTGSSLSQRSFDPEIIDSELGTNSFNIGAPAQPLNITAGSINVAFQNQHPKRVILALAYCSFAESDAVQAQTAFMLSHSKNLIDTANAYIHQVKDDNLINKSLSLNLLFPWSCYNTLKIKNNIINKFYNKSTLERDTTYVDRGYQSFDKTLDYTNLTGMYCSKQYDPIIRGRNFDTLSKIINTCKENNTELIIVNTPHTTFDVLSYGNAYFAEYYKLKQYCNNNGVDYYDFNFAKPELYKSEKSDFYNYEHLNQNGGTKFSKSFAKFLQIRDSGEDLDQYFYNKKDYLNSINYIANTWYETKKQSNGYIDVTAGSIHGTSVEPVYQFSIYDKATSKLQVLQDYSTENNFSFSASQYENLILRVKAKVNGSDKDYEALFDRPVSSMISNNISVPEMTTNNKLTVS